MVIWTGIRRSSYHPRGRLIISTLFFLQTLATPAAAQPETCREVQELNDDFRAGRIPPAFPLLQQNTCSLQDIAEPMARLLRHTYQQQDTEGLRNFARFLDETRLDCIDNDHHSAVHYLVIGLENELKNTPFSVTPPEGGPSAQSCRSLDPFITDLRRTAAAVPTQEPPRAPQEQGRQPSKNNNTYSRTRILEIVREELQKNKGLQNLHGAVSALEASRSASNLALALNILLSLVILVVFIALSYRDKSSRATTPATRASQSDGSFRKLNKDVQNLRERIDQASEKLDLLRAKIERPAGADIELYTLFEKLKGQFENVKNQVADTTARIRQLEEEPPTDLSPEERIHKEPEKQSSTLDKRAASAIVDTVEIEWGVLKRRWNPFKENRRGIYRRIQPWDNSEEQRLAVTVLKELPDEIESHPELQEDLKTVSGPLYEDYTRLTILSGFPRLEETLSSSAGRGEVRNTKRYQNNLSQIRNIQDLLAVIETTAVGREMETFTFKRWVREEFLGFADSFFKVWVIPDNASRLRNARAIVVKTLNHAGVEPIEIELGRTPFDSKLHVARSDSCEPDKPDGVVVQLIRSGFRDLEKDRILQRPEVVVNRV